MIQKRMTCLLALGILGCGGRADLAAGVIGTWSGTFTSDGICLDGRVIPRSTSTMEVSIAQGALTDLVRTTETGMACTIPLNVDGIFAEFFDLADPCMTFDGRPMRLKNWRLDLETKVEGGSGTIEGAAAGEFCTVGFTGRLTR